MKPPHSEHLPANPCRALCLWLPHLPLQRLSTVRPPLRRAALVVYEEHRPASFRVVECSRAAASHGVRPLMPLSEAKALAPLELEKSDPAADRAFLEKLAAWCEQFSPTVAVHQADCLLMDLTGLARLFGGEEAQIAQLRQTFRTQGLTTRIAVADNYAAAWALAHFSDRPVTLIAPGQSCQAIASLPIAALDLPPPIVATLNELGIYQIGQLLVLPRDGLAARFDAALLTALERATGERRETLEPYRAPPERVAAIEFESPLSDRLVLQTVVARLLEQIVPPLAAERRGIEAFACEFICEAHAVRMPVALYQPTANLKHLRELTELQLEKLALPGPVSKVRLLVGSTELLGVSQLGLFDDGRLAEERRHRAVLVNRLSSRLGPRAVVRPALIPDAQAEFAYRYRPLAGRKWGKGA